MGISRHSAFLWELISLGIKFADTLPLTAWGTLLVAINYRP